MNKVGLRLHLNSLTIIFLASSYPKRILRFVLHFFQWIPAVRKQHLPSLGVLEWLGDFCFYTSDVLVIPDMLELIFVWIQPQLRMINESEKELAKKYFRNKVNLRNIRMSFRIPKKIEKLAVAFVTFNTIHYSGKISVPVFIHEMVHIWQYQKYGSVYIFRALKAQRSKEGYDYGGLESLYNKMLNNYVFTDFNFEQQGEIFEDYCRMKESAHYGNPIAEASYEYFVGQVREDDGLLS